MTSKQAELDHMSVWERIWIAYWALWLQIHTYRTEWKELDR